MTAVPPDPRSPEGLALVELAKAMLDNEDGPGDSPWESLRQFEKGLLRLGRDNLARFLVETEQHVEDVVKGAQKLRIEQEHTIQTLREENERLRKQLTEPDSTV